MHKVTALALRDDNYRAHYMVQAPKLTIWQLDICISDIPAEDTMLVAFLSAALRASAFHARRLGGRRCSTVWTSGNPSTKANYAQ